MSGNDERETQMLCAVTAIILRQGYDKTTMSDIADEIDISRGDSLPFFQGRTL